MSDKNTVTLTIDGREVTVPAGLNLIEAARHAGKEVPHYCYHPRLSVAGNCRICLVEVEGWPKLEIGCNCQARDGMVVFTDNERVRETRQGVMELLLINHPLDCTRASRASSSRRRKNPRTCPGAKK
jgi:NADH-quinone oxidoreductase subunit G